MFWSHSIARESTNNKNFLTFFGLFSTILNTVSKKNRYLLFHYEKFKASKMLNREERMMSWKPPPLTLEIQQTCFMHTIL